MNGGVTLKRVNGNVQGRTTNGGVNIELAGDRWNGNGMDVKTTNGGYPGRAAALLGELEAETRNGGIHCDLPLQLPSIASRAACIDRLWAGGAL